MFDGLFDRVDPDTLDAPADVHGYDRYVVFFSGGKDSVACVLHLLEEGVDPSKIELHHHLVDGAEEEKTFMDWPVTSDYCRKFARALNMPIYFSWKEGGFLREMERNGDRTAPISFETPEGVLTKGGDRGKLGVRRKFPQVSPNLAQRWCSAYLKVDVGCRVLTSDPRFEHSKTLCVTGERAEESPSRSKYKTFEKHRSDLRHSVKKARYIDLWRPVHKYTEQEVWDLFNKYNINPHPAYKAGYSRVSCINCIFADKHQLATTRKYAPGLFEPIALKEDEYGVTIDRAKKKVHEKADQGTPYSAAEAHIEAGLTKIFAEPIIKDFVMPAGAFGEGAGPL